MGCFRFRFAAMTSAHLARLTTQVGWYLRRGAHDIGKNGVLAVAMIAATLALAGFVVIPEYRKLVSLERQIAESPRPPLSRPVRLDVRSGLERFYASFPPARDDLQLLEGLYAGAQAAGVRLDQGDYEMVGDDRSGLLAYRIKLPVRAGYLQTRDFVQRTLESMPNVALHEISFRRRDDGEIESVLSLTLYFRNS
jgi:hypothetical protein